MSATNEGRRWSTTSARMSGASSSETRGVGSVPIRGERATSSRWSSRTSHQDAVSHAEHLACRVADDGGHLGRSRRRLGQAGCDAQDAVERVAQALGGLALLGGLLVEAGVVDGERGPAAELLGDGQVGGAVAAAGLGLDEGDGAERPGVRRERHDQGRGEAEAAQQLEVLRVARGRLEHRVADLLVQLRLARADHVRHAGDGVGVGRVARLELAGGAHTLGVGVGHGDALEAAVGRPDVDGAPVGQARDDQARELAEGLAVVERAREDRAGLGEEAQGLLGGLALVDVAAEADDAQRLAVAAAQDDALAVDPAAGAVGPEVAELDVEARLVLRAGARAGRRGWPGRARGPSGRPARGRPPR